jgi:hypothetical protein
MKPSPLILLAALAATGCATYGPTWSEVSGNRYTRTTINRQPALIEKVDGHSAYASYPIKLDPGTHEIVLQGASNWPGGVALQTVTLDLHPCKRYYLNAQFEAPGQPRWTPVVDYVEDIAGCRLAGGQ